MKLGLDPTLTAPRIITAESLALATWYDAHPAIRRLWGIRFLAGLHSHSTTHQGVAMFYLRTVVLILMFAVVVLISPPGRAANDPIVTALMLKELADTSGKEALMITVEYPPGGGDPVHRHDAHAFVYVLEGSIVMQLRGGKEVTLKPGETFYEGPGDVHTVGRNASNTRPAKFLVLLLKNKGVDAVLPAD